VLNVMKNCAGDVPIQFNGLGFLANMMIAFQEELFPEREDQEGVIEVIFVAMEQHKRIANLQESGCKLIWELIEKDFENKHDIRKKLIAAKAISKVGRVLEMHLNHVNVQKWGKKVMEALLA
jgi:hypothetical protein